MFKQISGPNMRALPLAALVVIFIASHPARDTRARPVRAGARASPRLALTFDDGPSPVHTPRVLEVLRRNRVKATFFVLGENARRWPGLIRAMAAHGHLVANHSWDHPRDATEKEWLDQIRRTEAAIKAAGVTPARYFRPPHGLVTSRVRAACATLGYTVVLFTYLAPDYRRPGEAELTRGVLRASRPGAVVVLHDGGGDRRQTVAALPGIIAGLRQKGLEPARLDHILSRRQPAPRPLEGHMPPPAEESPSLTRSPTWPAVVEAPGSAGPR